MTALPEFRQFLKHNTPHTNIKGPRKRGNIDAETLFPEIFLGCANEQEAKKNVLLPCCANKVTFAEEKNVSESIQKHFCFRNKCCVWAQTGKTMFPRQCFLVCRGLKTYA